jgi:FMN phosphatase YigB (HAD superfamily)
MKYKILFLASIVFFAVVAKKNRLTKQTLPTNRSDIITDHENKKTTSIKAVVFTWCSIFEPDENDIERRVKERLGLLRSIGLLFKGIPKKEIIKKELFSLLNEIPVDANPIDPLTWKTDYPSWETDYQLPPIFEQFLLTSTNEQEQVVYKKVFDFLDNTPNIPSDSRRKILKGVADFIFLNEYMNQSMQPIKPMIQLARKLKDEGYTLILVGNCPGYAWDQFLEHFEVAKIVTELFLPKNIFISGKEKVLKTSQEMIKKVLKNHSFLHQNYLVIECNEHNLKYPKQIGMHTVVFNPQKNNFELFKQQFDAIIS